MSRRRRKNLEPDPSDSQRQAADLAAFRRMMQVSQGTFSLSFAVCDNRTLRDSLVKRLSDGQPGTLIVRLSSEVTDVLEAVRQTVSATAPAAIFVLDLETCIPFGSDTQPVLRVLNSSREQWERLGCPVVFWLADYAMSLLHAHAPDFWRYRSHQFEFVPEPVPLNEAAKETFSGYPMVDALPYEEKAFRIAELERRISEAGNPPSIDLLPHVMLWVYELSYLYQHTNRFGEAEDVLRGALSWAEERYGKEHIEVATVLSNLAQVLKATNKIEEAEPIMRHVLEVFEKKFKQSDPLVAVALNNLAALLHETNRSTEAEALMRRGLKIDEGIYGLNHSTVARGLNNLAQLLQDTNRLDEATPMMRRALDIDEHSFGPDHPLVAIRLNNLAGLLQSSNRLGEAEPMMRRALDIDVRSYGPDHPLVAMRLNNLAHLLHATNRMDEAEPLMKQAFALSLASLGLDHPNTQGVRNNYLALLHAMGIEEDEALERVAALTTGETG